MAKNITLLGASYPDVPSVVLPQTGGGTAQFYDLEEEIPEVGEICLGDVVICKDKAAEQAEEFGHSFEREIIYLFVHSVLHLLGYDHMEEDEKACMRAREEEIMEHLGVLR